MQKTKFGVAVGLVGAAIYFGALFGGYTVLALIAGYCLLFEENTWLKKTCVKAIALTMLFSVLRTLLGLVPDVFSLLSSAMSIININFYFSFINKVFSLLDDIVTLFKTVLFLVLGYVAVHEGTIAIPLVDKMISKYMD